MALNIDTTMDTNTDEEIYSPVNKRFSLEESDIENASAKYVCLYKINKESEEPFLMFYLVKDIITNELMFPEIYYCERKFEEKDIETIVPHKNEHGELELYYFVNDSSFYSSNDINVYALVDEIINHKKVNDTPIHESVISFFLEHIQFLFLRNSSGESTEVPIVAYSLLDANMNLNFHMTFGNFRREGMMGNNFYYTDYEHAMKQKNKGDTIIRYAIFLKKTYVVMNRDTDPEDTSPLSTNPLMKRITDYDGKWTELYDSVHLSPLLLEDGSSVTPMYVVKQYSQQIPLTYYK